MKKTVLMFFMLVNLPLFAQSDSIAYSREYEFKEGLYLTIDQFLMNAPILKSAVVSGYPKSQMDFISQVLEEKEIVFKGTDGKEQKIKTSSLWGYCQNRSVYLNFNNEFQRMVVIGTLCHFIATVYNPVGVQDPMDYNYGINTASELQQFLLDTRTNKVWTFNVKNTEELFKDDVALLTEFQALKKRQKPDMIFIYLRKFNEKHPLYLPKQ